MTEFGISVFCNLEHPLKALLPIDVTELGMLTLDRLVQFWNVKLLMALTELPIVADVIAVQP